MSDSDAADPAPSLPFVRLFTDGACSGNPGPGGWAYILKHPASGKVVEVSGGEAESINNRMELQALIEGLGALNRRTDVEIVTDSEYVVKGCQEWLPNWKRNGWRRKEGSSSSPSRTKSTGGSWTSCWRSTKCASPSSAATSATPKTSAATSSQWPPPGSSPES